jgi:hypothetical protein
MYLAGTNGMNEQTGSIAASNDKLSARRQSCIMKSISINIICIHTAFKRIILGKQLSVASVYALYSEA